MPVGVSGTCFLQPRQPPRLPVPHMVGINLRRLGHLSKAGFCSLIPTFLSVPASGWSP